MGAEQSTINEIKSIEEIVNIVNRGNYELVTPNAIRRKFPHDGDEDFIKPLKNVATDIVVEQFFQTEETIYRFHKLVYNTFREAIELYRKINGIDNGDLFFIYKGGNILRFVSKEFISQIPAVANEEFKRYYSPYFKRSDADFSIFIDPDLEDYDKVHDDMGLLSYLLQVRIRGIFLSNPGHYFDFMRYDKEYRKSVLMKYLPKFNSEGFSFTDITLVDYDYVPQSDFHIRFENDKAVRYDINNSNSFITVSYNDALLFYTGVDMDRPSHFKLIRSKVFFNLFDKHGNRLKVGGELIDVGIDYPDDVKNIHLIENFDKSLYVYSLNHKECELEFISYTTNNLIYDLEEILFEKYIFPWEDNKYSKRINRLFYMYFVDSFLKVKTGTKRLKLYNKIRDGFIGMIEGNRMNVSIDRSLEISKLPGFLNVIRDRAFTDDEKGKMQVLLELLIQNSNFTISLLEQIKSYCDRDGNISEEDIYTGDTSNLI